MSNKHAKSTFRSRVVGTKTPQKIIVYVEGLNTERTYIDHLKKSNLKVVPVVKRGNGIGCCMDFVNDSQKAFNTMSRQQRDKYTQKWLMFDYDGHADFGQAIQQARRSGFQVAFSSMCIEYWFLLHFQNQNGQPIPCVNGSHSQAQINMLNQHIDTYNKSIQPPQKQVTLYNAGSKNIEEDLYELMLAVNPVTHRRRVEDACKNAFRIHQTKLANGAEFQESVTTMYQFLETIGFVERDGNGEFVLSI